MRIISVSMFGIATASATSMPVESDLALVSSSTTTEATQGLAASIASLGQTCVDGYCSAARSVQGLYESGITRWNELSPQDMMALLYLVRRGLDFFRGEQPGAIQARRVRGARIENDSIFVVSRYLTCHSFFS